MPRKKMGKLRGRYGGTEARPNSEHGTTWAILELMGHRRLAGFITEQEIGGSAMLRLDVYDAKEP